MNGREIAVTPAAYSYPLLIKHCSTRRLLRQRIGKLFIGDLRRLTYLELRKRIGRLASALPEHKPVRRGREMVYLLAAEALKPKPSKIRAMSYEAALD